MSMHERKKKKEKEKERDTDGAEGDAMQDAKEWG